MCGCGNHPTFSLTLEFLFLYLQRFSKLSHNGHYSMHWGFHDEEDREIFALKTLISLLWSSPSTATNSLFIPLLSFCMSLFQLFS